MPPLITVGPNIRVTVDGNPANDRSESCLVTSPQDARYMVGASKRFTDPVGYGFALAAYATFDGGANWYDSGQLPLAPGWAGASDPAVAFDGAGAAYLVALPFLPGTGSDDDTGPTVGIAIYRSADGANWSQPQLIHSSSGDDKQSAAGDHSPSSRYAGRVYIVWDDEGHLAFARTTDNGQSWRGTAGQPAGSRLANDSFAPQVAVAANGTVYIAWIAGSQLKLVTSADGGDTFTAPSVIASGITQLSSPPLQAPDGFPELPGGTFRVLTLPALAAGAAGTVVVAWADYREGVSRIYYRRSADYGKTWNGASSGQPLLTGTVASGPKLHDFHPQLAVHPDGTVGCAFYEFGPMPVQNLINVVMGFSDNNAASFAYRATITDHPWDPAVDAPRSHGRSTTTFIGEYFGLTANDLGFFPFWTDTRTGVQEIFTARVGASTPSFSFAVSVEDQSNGHPLPPMTSIIAGGQDFTPGGRVDIAISNSSGKTAATLTATTDRFGTFTTGTSHKGARGYECDSELTGRATDQSSGLHADASSTVDCQ